MSRDATAARWNPALAAPRVWELFLDLLRECVQNGTVTRALLRDGMAQNHVRHDILTLVDWPSPRAAE